MAEYIEREAALTADFKISFKRLDTRIKTARDAVQAYANYIANLPTADVKPVVHGEWIYNEYGKPICSVCKKEMWRGAGGKYKPSDYCPSCGAEMR